jgi:predicted permease
MYQADDYLPSRPHVVVLGRSFWQRHYGGDVAVVGRTVALDGVPYTIIGVASQCGPLGEPDALLPYSEYNNRDRRYIATNHLFGKLKPGATLEQAAAEVRVIGAQLLSEYPKDNAALADFLTKGWASTLTPIEVFVRGRTGSILLLLQIVAALLLLLTCANVGSLLLARAGERQGEMGIRMALGAGPGRLMRQVLTECLIYSLGGAVLGLVLAWAFVRAYLAGASTDVMHMDNPAIDMLVAGVTAGVSIVAALLFGILPAMKAARADIATSIRQEKIGLSRRRQLVLTCLAASQVGVAVILLTSAGLMFNTMARLLQCDLGFDPTNVTMFTFRIRGDRMGLVDSLMPRIHALPGMMDVSGNGVPPMFWPDKRRFRIEGSEMSPVDAVIQRPLPGYFRTMGIPLRQGREFSDTDRLGSSNVVIVSDTLAQAYLPGKGPLDEYITLYGEGDDEGVKCQIVGVVGNIKNFGPRQDNAQPTVYRPFLQRAYPLFVLFVRAKGDAEQVIEPVCHELSLVDPEMPVEIESMPQAIRDRFGPERFVMLLTMMFGAIALVLAALGVGGLLAYLGRQRIRGIAIRIALGARPRDIRLLFLKWGIIPAIAGIVAGLAGSYFVTRLGRRFLYGVSETDPLTLSLVCAGLLVVAAVASYIPAWRASRIDPNSVLRCE